MILAYLFRNRLLLVLAGVEAFIWFGGSTGYQSGWGAWWLGMTYPVRPNDMGPALPVTS